MQILVFKIKNLYIKSLQDKFDLKDPFSNLKEAYGISLLYAPIHNTIKYC